MADNGDGWRAQLKPRPGQFIVICSRSYWSSRQFAARRVLAVRNWNVEVDQPFLNRDTIKLANVLKICTSSSEAEQIAAQLNDNRVRCAALAQAISEEYYDLQAAILDGTRLS